MAHMGFGYGERDGQECGKGVWAPSVMQSWSLSSIAHSSHASYFKSR